MLDERKIAFSVRGEEEQIVLSSVAGFCWWREALDIARVNHNIWLDIAGWQPKLLRRPVGEFYLPIKIMSDTIGASKILFGSDWPAFRLFNGGQKNWVKAFKESPPTLRESGITFTKEEMDAILGKGASKLLPS